MYKAVYLIIMKAKNLFQFLAGQDHFVATLAAISNYMSEVSKEDQYIHKILSVVFKFREVMHYVLASGLKLNWFLRVYNYFKVYFTC
jgi:hypothetical protein